ncbi:MAG: Zn-dependent alcohol dehydrogenase [Propionibacteriaceae bacterium]|nr:Zn-dependent alcohol dehydrogenase [Propionibacteriaceae bacterium]
MKAAVSRRPGEKFSIEEVQLADPIGQEVLIDVKASGLCHSDLHIALEGYGFEFPTVLGHEAAGVVAKIGPDVTDFAVGDHVVASLIQFCGRCEACLDGRVYQCWNPGVTQRGDNEPPRLTQNGEALFQYSAISGFAEQVLVHQNQLSVLPKEIPFTRAAILGCGVITGAGAAINSADIHPGQTVAVIGCGGVGLNAIQGARLAGAGAVIAIDLQPKKLELARRFGATHTINSGQVDPIEAIHEIAPRGVDHAFEVIGLKQTCQLAIDLVRVGGCAYIIGLQKPGNTIELKAWEDLVMGQKRVIGIQMGSTNPKHDIPMFAQLYLDGRFNLDDLVSGEIGLDQINEAYEALEGGQIARTIITSF